MLKLRRKQEQEKNVERKAEEREAHKQRSLQGMLNAHGTSGDDAGIAADGAAADGDGDEDITAEQGEDEDDDAAYYRQEVGEEPPEGEFWETALCKSRS